MKKGSKSAFTHLVSDNQLVEFFGAKSQQGLNWQSSCVRITIRLKLKMPMLAKYRIQISSEIQ